MKLIIKIIKPAKLENVTEALVEMGIQGIASREVSGFARQKGHKELYQGAEYAKDSPPPKLKLASP
jgi:nitrogen regulatory protein PII